uniref:Basic amino acid ABC transporter substrate-binding protein n=1 Tax=Ignisphaera aggregans TaxID=334771 RepID=A0A7J2U6V2_9CREN
MRITTLIVIAVILIAIIGVAIVIELAPMYQSSKKVLRVGTSPDFPPFEYIDNKTGEVVGIDIDLVKALAKKLGYDVQIIQMDFDGLIPALINKQIDIIASGMTITNERAQVVAFTIPYWKSDQAIVVRRGSSFKPMGLDDLVGRTVGVQSGTTAQDLLQKYVNSTGKQINIKIYTSYVLAVQDLENGNVDAVVIDSPVASMFERIRNVNITAVIPTNESYGLAVRKEDTALLNQLNNALKEFLNTTDWQAILQKYLGV